MEDVRYEKVTSVPAEEIVELYQAGGWWKEDARARRVIPAMIAGSFCFMVARADEGGIIGMGRAISDGVSDAYIQDVVVRPEYRGRGIGSELVRRLVAHCRAHSLEWIGLVAEPGTLPFYEALGFAPLAGYMPMRHA